MHLCIFVPRECFVNSEDFVSLVINLKYAHEFISLSFIIYNLISVDLHLDYRLL